MRAILSTFQSRPSITSKNQFKRRIEAPVRLESRKIPVIEDHTARRSLWLRRTAGAKWRGTNSQSEEAEVNRYSQNCTYTR